MDKSEARAVLEEFLKMPLGSAEKVLETFAALPGARYERDADTRNFVYVPGTRGDRVLLVAHADTVWDSQYIGSGWIEEFELDLVREGEVYHGDDIEKAVGLGADDRAGCAMLWLLRNSGHSLLVLDGEEHGQQGAEYLKNAFPDLYEEINAHNYILELDRSGAHDYKTYQIPVGQDFIDYIEENTGFTCPGNRAYTDICTLCDSVSGANLSVGYRNEHTYKEELDFDVWYKNLSIIEKMISGEQPKFPTLK